MIPVIQTETTRAESMESLVRAGTMLARDQNFKTIIAALVEQAQDISLADLSAFYLLKNPENRKSDLKLVYKRGRYELPDRLDGPSELVQFVRECREALVINQAGPEKAVPVFLKEALLHKDMASGMALLICTAKRDIGILAVNSKKPEFFKKDRFLFLDSLAKLAGGVLETSRLFLEMKEYLQKIEALERYQECVFDSMTNMIVTTDPQGRIHYFNRTAGETLDLREDHLNQPLGDVFKDSLSGKSLKNIGASLADGRELLGLQGIYRAGGKEIDYSLNITPLTTARGRREGLTLLFTNQTRENQLKTKVDAVTEERRLIKDMFCRYVSNDVVSNLIESPERIKPGGDKKNATVFFADIRGYTSFSEGKEPEEIIEVLNDYFGEVVEHVLAHRGYIDKFIGDCIMAVWGVPLSAAEDDAVNAVSCALTIQELVRSARRNFFRKEAAGLKIGIGINTGPLVAGNLGSAQRMDYSVVGDTVNLAARLEGVARANEIIISQATRDQLGDRFRLEKKPDVKVKGKEKPIQIYNVLGFKK